MGEGADFWVDFPSSAAGLALLSPHFISFSISQQCTPIEVNAVLQQVNLATWGYVTWRIMYFWLAPKWGFLWVTSRPGRNGSTHQPGLPHSTCPLWTFVSFTQVGGFDQVSSLTRVQCLSNVIPQQVTLATWNYTTWHIMCFWLAPMWGFLWVTSRPGRNGSTHQPEWIQSNRPFANISSILTGWTIWTGRLIAKKANISVSWIFRIPSGFFLIQ